MKQSPMLPGSEKASITVSKSQRTSSAMAYIKASPPVLVSVVNKGEGFAADDAGKEA
jgi:hypothetical protein